MENRGSDTAPGIGCVLYERVRFYCMVSTIMVIILSLCHRELQCRGAALSAPVAAAEKRPHFKPSQIFQTDNEGCLCSVMSHCGPRGPIHVVLRMLWYLNIIT